MDARTNNLQKQLAKEMRLSVKKFTTKLNREMKEKIDIVFRGKASSPSPRSTKPTEIAGRQRRQKRTTAAVGGSSISSRHPASFSPSISRSSSGNDNILIKDTASLSPPLQSRSASPASPCGGSKNGGNDGSSNDDLSDIHDADDHDEYKDYSSYESSVDPTPVKDDAKNKLRLVHPYAVDKKILSDPASGLKELGGDTLGLDQADIGVQGQLGEGNVTDGTKKTPQDRVELPRKTSNSVSSERLVIVSCACFFFAMFWFYYERAEPHTLFTFLMSNPIHHRQVLMCNTAHLRLLPPQGSMKAAMIKSPSHVVLVVWLGSKAASLFLASPRSCQALLVVVLVVNVYGMILANSSMIQDIMKFSPSSILPVPTQTQF